MNDEAFLFFKKKKNTIKIPSIFEIRTAIENREIAMVLYKSFIVSLSNWDTPNDGDSKQYF